ncbi:4-hydroxy-3-methylbut-2-enyl diphosphate reductase [Stieleria varia]|uniref:4-hydroxy-3-methylbut-2-enyl diphosphate reductase n=1 Tax=Stieleria varia TaxID=2528005 RepID=A0A5C6AH61_9BACT|nr:4-hydroxy-3-methylbut-2-enyl diphosphate reductase [Stieleria varia]TWT98515.1 4-hydroxy-3-methylbut-2-enyl diphosphate reductase [Stieleria varia]
MTTIIRATHLGFCFGVRDALKAAEQIERPEETAVYGELVHNAEVNQWLNSRRFETIAEAEREGLPARSQVMITAHGISQTRRDALIQAGKRLIDTTCPLVQRVHAAATKLAEQDHFVVVIGSRDHVEVQGITEDLPEGRWEVVSRVDEVSVYPAKKIGIVCQTTMPGEVAQACRDAIALSNPDACLRWINTICRPTKQRQSAIDALCAQTQLVIVVGGINSNNTRRLAQRCRTLGSVAYHVQSPRDIRGEWFDGVETVGLTAGTSTPDETIDAVQERIEQLTRSQHKVDDRRQWSNRQWSIYFRNNLADTPAVPWSRSPTLTPAESRAVIGSIKTFQLGESGEGKHLLACARSWIDTGGDPDYLDAAKLFLDEEHVHSDLLARFLRQENECLLHKQWSDGCFRFLRHLAGLRTSVSVLVTAEIMAQVYYLALFRATQSSTLRAICRRVMRDERSHVQFQQQQKNLLAQGWSSFRRRIVSLMERVLFEIACRIVWHDHRSVFESAKMNWNEFRNRSLRRWHAANRG